jgi:fructoselysine-6-P-deglycase FrlB-like protein
VFRTESIPHPIRSGAGREPAPRALADMALGSPLARGRPESASTSLPALPPDHPEADAVCLIQSFYGLAIRLAEQRGSNADAPRHLQKVTRTR